jgi:hypothetical protein
MLALEVVTKGSTVIVEHNTGIGLGQNLVLAPGQVIEREQQIQTITLGLEIITQQPQQTHMGAGASTRTAHGLTERMVIGHTVLMVAGVPVIALVHGLLFSVLAIRLQYRVARTLM